MVKRALQLALCLVLLIVGPGVGSTHTVPYPGAESEGWVYLKKHYHRYASGSIDTSKWAHFDWRPYGLSSAWADRVRSAGSRWRLATDGLIYIYRWDSSRVPS
jgi:hypothetical protein